MKRGYHGTYHRMSTWHLGRYVTEFEDRHNQRPMDTLDQMESMVRWSEGKRLRYKDLVAASPNPRRRVGRRPAVWRTAPRRGHGGTAPSPPLARPPRRPAPRDELTVTLGENRREPAPYACDSL